MAVRSGRHTLGYETFGRPGRPVALGYETFHRPKRSATLGYETFRRPERPATLGYVTFGRPKRPAELGYETFGLPEPLGALGYETFGRPKRPATIGYETFGRPERPARLGYETFDCGAPLTWREAPCRFRKGRRRRPVDMARSAMSVSRDARCARTSNRNTDRQSKRRQSCFSLCSEPGTHGPRIRI